MGILTGKTAMVTGTSQGIGAAIGETLIRAGCHVCLHYFSSDEQPKELQKLASGHPQKIVRVQGDLTREADVTRCVATAVGELGRFDVLINNSGALVSRSSVEDITPIYWQTLIDINLTSMMLVTKAMVPHLNQEAGASIVNVSSLAGRAGGHPGSLVYATCKGAVLTWTRALSRELAPRGIRVNAVAPGFIDGTRFHETHTTRQAATDTIAAIPLGRAGTAYDVARAVAFLASEFDGFITGETIDINGGVYSA